MSIPLSDVLTALRAYPGGVTTAVLAARLGMKRHSLGSRLSKQHLWGRNTVDREPRRVVRAGVAYDEYLWRSRA